LGFARKLKISLAVIPSTRSFVWSISMAKARSGAWLPEPCTNVAREAGFGPYLMDPIGFVMSKRMLRTTKQFAEASSRGGKRRARRDVSR
jgi:hypothetical protein